MVSVTTRINDAVHECTSQKDVEIAIIEMCKKRFLLTHGTPLINAITLAQDLGQLGGSTAVANILESTYEVQAEIYRITSELLKFIHDLARKYSKPSMSTKIRI